MLAGSVVGQVVGKEEVVEMMGTGGADELAQLNPSGHDWHVHCPSNEYSPRRHGFQEPSSPHANPAGQGELMLVQLVETGMLAGSQRKGGKKVMSQYLAASFYCWILCA